MVSRSYYSESERFPLKTVSHIKVNTLKNLDIKKTSGIETILPKIIKTSPNFCDSLLTKAINANIAQNIRKIYGCFNDPTHDFRNFLSIFKDC